MKTRKRINRAAMVVGVGALLGVLLLPLSGQSQAPRPAPPKGISLTAGPRGGVETVTAGAKRIPFGITPQQAASPLDIRGGIRIYDIAPIQTLAQGTFGGRETSEYFYGVFVEGKAVGWAQVTANANGTGQLTSLLGNGPPSVNGTPAAPPLAAAVDDALRKLSTSPQILAGSFEVRFLSTPWIADSGAYYALWLKSATDTRDLIYTFQQQAKPLIVEADHLYTVTDFMKILQPLMRQRVEKDSKQ